jgi:hypothetical protein
VNISKSPPVLHRLIKNTKKNGKIVFSTDFTFAHYANDTLVRLEELKIEYVPKVQNPPNDPQIRPIENFCANLNRKVYSNNYPPKDVKYLAKIRKDLKSIETTGIETTKKGSKGPQTGINFYLQVISVYFSSEIMNKIPS